jgi:hypothetical protein
MGTGQGPRASSFAAPSFSAPCRVGADVSFVCMLCICVAVVRSWRRRRTGRRPRGGWGPQAPPWLPSSYGKIYHHKYNIHKISEPTEKGDRVKMLCTIPEWLLVLPVWPGRASQLRDLRARLQEAWAANLQQLQHIEATLHPPAQRAAEEGDGVEEGQGSAPRITIPPTGSARHLVPTQSLLYYFLTGVVILLLG